MSIEQLLKQPKFGASLGLHRIQAVLDELEHPFNAIKITGSNGKGSTAIFLSHLLLALGIHHGMFTSPHLLKFNERIKIDGKDIDDAELDESCRWFNHYQKLWLKQFPEEHLGAFEAITAMALHHFASKKVENLILEAGIGGRFDSTRPVNGNFVALTSVDLEHGDLLGNSLEEIAYDKIDLCPEDGTLVLGYIEPQGLLHKIDAYCRLKNIRLLIAEELCVLKELKNTGDGMVVEFVFQGEETGPIEVSLCGEHQVRNLQVAIVIGWHWCQRYQSQVTFSAFIKALTVAFKDVVWPGRFEKICDSPPIYIDGAHSPDAVKHCVNTARQRLAGQKILLVAGVSSNKEAEGIVAGLLGIADEVIFTRAYHRGLDAEKLAELSGEYRQDLLMSTVETVEEAVKLAIEKALASDMAVLVAGSLFLAIEARQIVNGKSAKDLSFF